MALFLSLSSGSNGNCYYLGTRQAGILIDLGIGTRTIRKRLLENGLSIENVKAVLVSHDHFDHIRSLGSFTEKYKLPVYTTSECIKAFEKHYCTKGYMSGCCRAAECGTKTGIRLSEDLTLQFTPFRVPHDASDTVGYHIELEDTTVTFITDIGDVTEDALRYASASEHLIIEANYDVDMLMRGNYSADLKLRIMQGHGHLSNEQTASLLSGAAKMKGSRLKRVYLCHLSENNNTPKTALDTIKPAIPQGIAVECLPRREASGIFEILKSSN